MKIKEILKNENIKHEEIRDLLDIKSKSTLSLKLNGKSHFSTGQAKKIKDYINKKTNKNYTIEELF